LQKVGQWAIGNRQWAIVEGMESYYYPLLFYIDLSTTIVAIAVITKRDYNSLSIRKIDIFMTATAPNLDTKYEPKATEGKWQEAWQQNRVFEANPQASGDSYCIVIPPPNVTGSLHMGHAFNISLIDTLVRYHRMKGDNTLCLPGIDHASIAVQTILEKQLKAEGKTRYDIGREKFLERAWEWKGRSGGTIINQLQRIGLSADWSRQRFTLDEKLSEAVKTAFIQLYEEGLIYRSNYLVNWCPESQSAVSDLEVDSKEVDGNLWHFRYPLSDGSGYVEVATTRPETMLGDTAVAVNPTDERYKDLVGKTLKLPLVGREIPVIADESVDREFGTGCVKVTPAHDPNDFETGKRHNLPFINIMNKDGTLNENAGEFVGQDRFVARKNVVAKLDEGGFLVKIEPYKHNVPYSERGKVPVEPLLSTQWFVKIESLAQKALSCLDKDNSPRFVPDRWVKVYRDWLVKLKDWCISRQLWWGHQIPAWYAISETNGEILDNTPFIVARNEVEAMEKAKVKYGENVKLERDPDVLDTWFSSGLWPFSTLGWDENTEDLQTYYPNSVLVTGFDIIFFWVARMTMMAGHFTDAMPFQDVYIHGLVRDENGKKMSKTAGNGIDPLFLIDRYGTDALRYTLIKEVAGAGQDISLQLDRKVYEFWSIESQLKVLPIGDNGDKILELLPKGEKSDLIAELKKVLPKKSPSELLLELQQVIQNNTESKLKSIVKEISEASMSESVEASRNFANKLWNASRFVMMNLEGKTPQQLQPPATEGLQLADRWILSRYYQIVRQTRSLIENYGLGEAAKSLYEFIWGDFCDWYIELVKTRLWEEGNSTAKLVAQQTLAYVLEGILKLLHPFMPHITEEIWHTLTQEKGDYLALQSYPEADASYIDSNLEANFDLLIDTIRTIRNLRAEAGIKQGAKITVILQTESQKEREVLDAAQIYIKDTAKVERLSIVSNLETETGQSIAGVCGTIQVLIPLTGLTDIAALCAKLEKNISKLEGEIKSLTGRLNNPNFVNKAAPEVVQTAKDALAEVTKQTEILRERLERLQ
jgi:valyl-tRNA synthetase